MSAISVRVSASNDDGTKDTESAWANGGSGIFAGFETFHSQVWKHAIRFIGITIAQGSTINSATLTYTANSTNAGILATILHGFAEDNTSDFSGGDPSGRSKTTASANFNRSGVAFNTTYTVDVTSIIQEIVNRGGWSSGNSLGFINEDNGSTSSNMSFYAYDGDSTKAVLLDVDYGTGTTTSSSTSSTTTSTSTSSTTSSTSTTTLPLEFTGMKISKPNIDVLKTNMPNDLIFSSQYGTLKYFDKIKTKVIFTASGSNISANTTYNHNLGYYPFVEVFVRVYIGTPSGNFEYCPFAGSGISVAYDATYLITPTTIKLYGAINGISSDTWTFEFLIFIFKNNLKL